MDAKRAAEQQAKSSKQRQTKKRTSQESEEEIEPEDALNFIYKKRDGHDIKRER